ncbi:MAG: Fic family protein [Candidatus Zixiibacteriota bacterium]
MPDLSGKLEEVLGFNRPDVGKYLAAVHYPNYLYWDKVRFMNRPKGMSPEEFWALVKALRTYSPSRSSTVVKDEKGRHFTWDPLPGFDRFQHIVDMKLGGYLESSLVGDPSARRRYITRGIMEEAIASSQLEGANTTRRVAKKMLVENRKPRTVSEQMILNNYQAMLQIEESLRHQDLSVPNIQELHVTLTKDTIGSGDVGRLRTDADEDRVVVCDPATGLIYHVPPSEKFMRREIVRLVSYANDNTETIPFVHPVIKAIILHFWIGYLHPFTDGNGRLARTLFYWYVLRHDYWAFSYLPLSKLIRQSPAQYRDAYVYSEQDDNDLNYFLDYNVRKIEQARVDFQKYVQRKELENRRMSKLAQSKYALNDRQIQLLRYLYKNEDESATIKTFSRINNVGILTARKDLERLETLGFLSSAKVGRERPFRATSKLSELFG